ncbi:Uncharacterized protein Fot_00391 [Forsythia ovata]|uniref:Uncharacterized protein n=1 Tax=Forsythia ovata TaxID=205694 RepID=A0ABD1X110_9LAMI
MVGPPMDQTIAGVQLEGTGAPRMTLRRGAPFKKMVAIAALALGTVEALSMMMKIMVTAEYLYPDLYGCFFPSPFLNCLESASALLGKSRHGEFTRSLYGHKEVERLSIDVMSNK